MRNSSRGFQESTITRVFGAVGLMVALYGVALSATVLSEKPANPGEESVKWFVRTASATQAEPVWKRAVARGASFWAPATPDAGASSTPARGTAPTGLSFWTSREADAPASGLRVASGPGAG